MRTIRDFKTKDFYTRAKSALLKAYESDTDSPWDLAWDLLEKEFNTDKHKAILLQYEHDNYNPAEIVSDCLDMARNWQVLDYTEIDLPDWNSLFVVVIVEK